MKIQIEFNKECPNNFKIEHIKDTVRVNGFFCRECKYYKEFNFEERYIICTYKDLNKKISLIKGLIK